ncbi:MAG: glycosyltransferase family 4 protein [Candidatus Eisenbacteria bacterium]|nr:glycosyltransferase family 4 protein [Candidatus Eisenbacteria bacterium]
MKIAMVGLFPRDPARLLGGVEAVTLRLAEGLAAREEVELHVVVASLAWERGTFPAPGRTIHSVGGSRLLGNVLLGLPMRRRIAAAIRRIDPDVVHAHSADAFALGALDSGYPTVVTIHGLIEAENRLARAPMQRLRAAFRDRIVGEALRRAQNVILLSPYVREHYGDALAHARSWVIENPVAPLFFETTGDPEPDRVLFSGLLIPRKGLRNLIDAFRIASRERPALRLRLAGLDTDGAYRRALDERVARLGLVGRVDFLGGLSPERLAEEYARAAMTVLVSRQDTAPVAVQEAMAVGRPVIASPVGGLPRLVADGESGFLVPHGDPDALARRIVEIAGDAPLARRMGRFARAEAERRFSSSAVAAKTIDVYKEVASGDRRGRTAVTRPSKGGGGSA